MPRSVLERFWDVEEPSSWMVRGTLLQIKSNEQEQCQEQRIKIREKIREQRKIINGETSGLGNLISYSSEYDDKESHSNAEKREFRLTGYDVLKHRRKLKKLHELTIGRISTDTRDGFENSTVTSEDYVSLHYANTLNNLPRNNHKQRLSKKELAKTVTERRRASLERLQKSVFQNTGLVLPKIDLVGPFTSENESANEVSESKRGSRGGFFPGIRGNRDIKEKLKFADAYDLGDMRLQLNDVMNEAASRRSGMKKHGSMSLSNNRTGKRSSTESKLPPLTEETQAGKERKDRHGQEKKSGKRKIRGTEKEVMKCPVKELALPNIQEVEEYKPSYSRNLLSIYRYSCLPPLY